MQWDIVAHRLNSWCSESDTPGKKQIHPSR
jgi:hypothetical protein